MNEELQSSNEELQSSNEELETTNEELQSTNEELQTAYSEMRTMYEERDNDARRIRSIKEELQISNDRLSLLVDSQNLGIIDIDITKNCLYHVNEKFAEILGYDVNEFKKHKNIEEYIDKLISPEHILQKEKLYDQLILGKIDKFDLNLQIRTKNEEYIWVRYFNVSMKNELTGKVNRVLGTISKKEVS